MTERLYKYFINKDGLPDRRVTAVHPKIGAYVVRASMLMKEELRAIVCCEWLNKMVEDREFNKNGNKSICQLFKVVTYKNTKKTFVVVRKLLVNDLDSGIEFNMEGKG